MSAGICACVACICKQMTVHLNIKVRKVIGAVRRNDLAAVCSVFGHRDCVVGAHRTSYVLAVGISPLIRKFLRIRRIDCGLQFHFRTIVSRHILIDCREIDKIRDIKMK